MRGALVITGLLALIAGGWVYLDERPLVWLAGAFLWPVWARAHARSAKERQQMSKRFSREVLRLCLHGTLKPEKYADLEDLVGQGNGVANPRLT